MSTRRLAGRFQHGPKLVSRRGDTDADVEVPPEMYLYRDRTLALLKRYVRLSVELGRVPSLLGREFFRSRVTSYRMHNFEDVVIFVHDVERCLEKLEAFSQQLIARIALQEHTQQSAATLLDCTVRTVQRRYPEALDRLSLILLQSELLQNLGDQAVFGRPADETEAVPEGLPPKKPVGRVMACQEPLPLAQAVSC